LHRTISLSHVVDLIVVEDVFKTETQKIIAEDSESKELCRVYGVKNPVIQYESTTKGVFE